MPPALLIKNAVVITPAARRARGWLLCEGRTIRLLGSGNAPDFDHTHVIDAGGLTLLPGFIDVHVHGALGHDTMDASPEGLRVMAQFYAQHGVTSFLATTWSGTTQRTLQALNTVAAVQGPQPGGATLLGVHLEGPYLNPDRCGAQNREVIRPAARDEALQFLDTNVIRLVSLAPEFEMNHWLITECVRRGIVVSAAHTAATYDQMMTAIRLGITHATHTYNAMTGLNHREPGTLGAVMTSPDVFCELIADNIHVHPVAMAILLATKGIDRLILITDAVSVAALPDGSYEVDSRPVVIRDGAVRLPDGTLAGSTLTMDRALHNLSLATGQPITSLWPTSSLNAARSIRIADRKGSLEVGKDADLVLIDDQVNVYLTVVEGQIVYQRDRGAHGVVVD